MSTDGVVAVEAKVEGVEDIWASFAALAKRLAADPTLIPRIKQTLEIWGLWPFSTGGAPEAGPLDAAIEALVAEAVADPEKLGDGKILELLKGLSKFIQSNPAILALLLKLIGV